MHINRKHFKAMSLIINNHKNLMFSIYLLSQEVKQKTLKKIET